MRGRRPEVLYLRGYYWCLDIECDDLKATKIHCVCVRNLVSDEERTFYDKDSFLAFHSRDFRYVGHNLLSFDIPNLNRLWDTGLELDRCCDTLVLSLLFNPALEDGHSLAAWGRRLKFPKGEISDWSECTPEMVEYCRNDVRLTCLLYKKLTERMLKIGYSEQSAEIEHKIRVIINDQQRNGFYFDVSELRTFFSSLESSKPILPSRYTDYFRRVSNLLRQVPSEETRMEVFLHSLRRQGIDTKGLS